MLHNVASEARLNHTSPVMTERGDIASSSAERSAHHHRHRRRHRPRPFYEKWIYPNRRLLKTAALFCVMIVLTYYLWEMMAK